VATTRVLGIRHHGPGSARSLVAALDELSPDAVLVEGPPDADELIPLVADADMAPPVAILVYRPDEPARAVYYPFAEFSPEWQALRWAVARGVPARFMDLPMHHRFAMRLGRPRGEDTDPIELLGKAAGYADAERWWEQVVEERRDPTGVFAAILEAMTAVRADLPAPEGEEALREAWMRRTIRAAARDGRERIAVVCGAWHGPALDGRPAKADDALLRGLPRIKTAATWVPWTYGRLTFASGYGAGVRSPGWYDHLWRVRDGSAARWMARVARLLRGEDLDASSAHVIDAVRLAEALAALRGRAAVGLDELTEATRAVLTFGDDLPLRLIHERLIVGETLGAVGERAPAVPLARDLEAESRRLRLKREASERALELDLRRTIDLERSHLLHRLQLLGVAWGEPEESAVEARGTFRERWRLSWDPDLAVSLIEAGMWGNTVAEAAAACARDLVDQAATLARAGELLDLVLLAALPEAVARVMERLDALAALTADVLALMGALPPLARVLRYGDVRRSELGVIAHVVDGLVARVAVGLPAACASLDDRAAADMEEAITAVNGALAVAGREEHRGPWREALAAVAADERVHGLVGGRALRLLLDAGVASRDEVLRRTGLALSPARPPEAAAAWAEGFLKGSGLMLLHDDALWEVVDRWLAVLADDAFVQVLPLVRRTFASYAPAERREIGARARRELAGEAAVVAPALGFDEERAAPVVARVVEILGARGG
jgi:hypothetical protein